MKKRAVLLVGSALFLAFTGCGETAGESDTASKTDTEPKTIVQMPTAHLLLPEHISVSDYQETTKI